MTERLQVDGMESSAEVDLVSARESHRAQRGSGLVEFSVLVALVAVVTIASVRGLGQTIHIKFADARDAIALGAGDVDD